MNAIQVCRLCDAPGGHLVSEEVSGAPESRVYRCAECGIVFLHPIMDPAEERTFYERDFPSYMEERHAPGGADPASHFQAHRPEAERRLALVRDILSPGMAALDIGSATGYFLHAVRPYVRSVTGVEPGEEFAAYARTQGITTVSSLAHLPGRSFDLAFLFYVLEHMRDPLDFLTQVRRVIRPGGLLVLEVPNVEDALVSLYDLPAFRRFYYQRAHYYYFSPQTLVALLQRAGYIPKVQPVQRYDLSNHMCWMMTGRPGGKGKFRHVFSDDLERAYAECLKTHWKCDTVLAVAEVPRGV